MMDDYTTQISDAESEEDNIYPFLVPPEMQGTLCKWTNYIHGWQNRYIVLKDGKLSYYKNENETIFGCRGSISVQRASVKPHEIDECRFDVCLNDCVWYLRTNTPEEKHQWVDAIDKHKECEGLRRHGSTLSLTSATFSTTSAPSFKRSKGGAYEGDTGLREKLSEIDTYRDIILKQIETLQTYFDSCAQAVKNGPCNGGLESDISEDITDSTLVHSEISSEVIYRHAQAVVDFRGEALTFKATTAGILTTLSNCMDVMSQREEALKRKFEKEVEKRKKLEEKLKTLNMNAQTQGEAPAMKFVVMGGPDYEEGPHSVIGEEEFYDAVESALDKMEEEEEFRERLRHKQKHMPQQPAYKHPLWPEIEKYTEEQLGYAQESVEGDGGVWQVFCEEGEMKMYRRELEEDGLVVDPLKALHQVRGVTAHEMAHHFWSPDVRFQWDTSIEQMTVLDMISEDTLIFLQLHKRVWPTAQRDALFWSHIRHINKTNNNNLNANAKDTWIVTNKSTQHPDAPNDGNCVRVDLIVCFVCQTYIDPPLLQGESLTRDRLLCKVTYCSIVNPGGWAPASVLRAVYKREYPKFLKRFTQYVVDKCQGSEIMFEGLAVQDHSKHWRG